MDKIKLMMLMIFVSSCATGKTYTNPLLAQTATSAIEYQQGFNTAKMNCMSGAYNIGTMNNLRNPTNSTNPNAQLNQAQADFGQALQNYNLNNSRQEFYDACMGSYGWVPE